ncbi:hypothetical protein [Nannocystis sp.]|uniref:hypothetical protein n=1 Tax=Nannocystis sp. TaxID=1962667 RepID=UPI0025D561DC|nr:hypothetical protein [Nannocystis sp.]MBK7826336.1 hypothetical protein [Nannocystis sp.]
MDLGAAREGQADDGVLLAVAGVVQGDAQAQVGEVAVAADDDDLVAELLHDLKAALGVDLEVDLQAVGLGRGGAREDRERGAEDEAAAEPAVGGGAADGRRHLGTVA